MVKIEITVVYLVFEFQLCHSHSKLFTVSSKFVFAVYKVYIERKIDALAMINMAALNHTSIAFTQCIYNLYIEIERTEEICREKGWN